MRVRLWRRHISIPNVQALTFSQGLSNVGPTFAHVVVNGHGNFDSSVMVRIALGFIESQKAVLLDFVEGSLDDPTVAR